MTLYPTLAVLYFTTIFFGGRHIWVYTWTEIFIFACTLFFLAYSIIKNFRKNEPVYIIKDPIPLVALFFLVLVLFQLVPLPHGLSKTISPMSFEIWKRSPLPSNQFFPISIYPYATQESLIYCFALLLVYLWVIYSPFTDLFLLYKSLNKLIVNPPKGGFFEY